MVKVHDERICSVCGRELCNNRNRKTHEQKIHGIDHGFIFKNGSSVAGKKKESLSLHHRDLDEINGDELGSHDCKLKKEI